MEEERTNEGPSYYIDLDGTGNRELSLSVLIAERKCYEHRPREADMALRNSEPQSHIVDIAGHCFETADYLLEDTPLKEAIFRVILAGGNEPITAQDVSEALTERWTTSAYPRDLSTRVIGRLLEHSGNYHIVAVREPEPEPEIPSLDVSGSPEVAGDSVEEESEAPTPIAEATEDTSGDAGEDAEQAGDTADPPDGESEEEN